MSVPPVQDLSVISGQEEEALRHARSDRPVYLNESRIDFGRIKSAFAIALHMHQPLIPAGGGDLGSAAIISNLQHMMENQHIGDNHNAPVFCWCYKRIGEFVPQLVNEGKEPRVMLDYSGQLFYAFQQMGREDILGPLREVAQNPQYRRCVEWLGTGWGHPVAPSTPVQDFRLHVLAWQQHFAAVFGQEALERVRGFSPSEMALPNQPDVAYAFVKTLRDCGYRWVLVQEHTIETPEGHGVQRPHLPHRLVCRNSAGEEASILVLIKTQGSDTKLVAQMQPYYEAKGLSRLELGGKSVPPLVSQIGDGENGGVMMNEFPDAFNNNMRAASGSETPAMNGTEYLEHLFASGVQESDLPVVQPIHQHRIWQRFQPGEGGEKLNAVIEELRKEDHRFHMDGGSWTSNLSWVQGYDSVLDPMQKASAAFQRKVLDAGVATDDPRYRRALFHLMTAETSCYRYWGEGQWTDYGREISRRALEIVEREF